MAVGAGVEGEVARLESRLTAQRIGYRRGDTTDRATLDSLGIEAFDHVIVLCYDWLDACSAPTRGP